MRQIIGWISFVAGCLAYLYDFVLLNFFLNWMPGWIIALVLLVIGALLLGVRIGAFFGVFFGLSAIGNLMYCIAASSSAGSIGILIFVIISLLLLKSGSFITRTIRSNPG